MKMTHSKMVTAVTFVSTMMLSSVGGMAKGEDIDLKRAIAISLEATGGGKVLEAKRDHEDEMMTYEVEVLSNDKLTEYTIDAATGKVVETSTESFFSKIFNWKENKEREVLKTATLTLEEAIDLSLKDTPGNPVEAEVKVEKGKGSFEITILSGNTETEVNVDPVSGKINHTKIGKDDEDSKKGKNEHEDSEDDDND